MCGPSFEFLQGARGRRFEQLTELAQYSERVGQAQQALQRDLAAILEALE